MSFPSVLSEKHSADDSPDEDSGHDSADSLSVPVDDRERIMHMESAMAWIREEVVSQSREPASLGCPLRCVFGSENAHLSGLTPKCVCYFRGEKTNAQFR